MDSFFGFGHASLNLCQSDVAASSEFGALDRHAGSECRPELRIVRFALRQSVTIGRQPSPQGMLLVKVAQQLLEFGKSNRYRDAPVFGRNGIGPVYDQGILAVLPK